tara:strand:- start:1309 stop:2049 length:741 start_codon:yes stop_codon:yes gene_type:complete
MNLIKLIKLITSKLLQKIDLILLKKEKYLFLSRSHPYLRTLDLIQKNILNKNKIIFEVGGGIGDRVKYLNRSLKGNNKFYIFEPNNYLFKNLKKNLYNENRFKIYNFGFSKLNKKAKLYVTEDPLLASNYKALFTKKFKTQISQFYKMKKFINDNKINKIDCLLINTQGSELEILESMEEKIKKTKLIFIEVDLVPRYELNNNKNYLIKILSFFNDNGFLLVDITLIKNENSKSKIKMLELAFLKN